MPSTFLSLHYHLVFSTKHRTASIAKDWQSRLHGYLGGIITRLGGFPQIVGGVADHVHLLVGLKATHTLSDVMRELKKSSSEWVHTEIHSPQFAWQEGYAAFTVSPHACPGVMGYIEHQESHHHQNPFREELIELLHKAGVKYEERFLD